MLKPIVFGSWFAYYGLNLTEVIEKYCINKDKPELNCDGKCYLSEKLGLDSNTEEKPKLIINEAFHISFFHNQEKYVFENFEFTKSLNSFSYHINYNSLILEVLDAPPKLV